MDFVYQEGLKLAELLRERAKLVIICRFMFKRVVVLKPNYASNVWTL